MGKGRNADGSGRNWVGDLAYYDKYGTGHTQHEWMSTREYRRKRERELKRLMKKASKNHERNSTKP